MGIRVWDNEMSNRDNGGESPFRSMGSCILLCACAGQLQSHRCEDLFMTSRTLPLLPLLHSVLLIASSFPCVCAVSLCLCLFEMLQKVVCACCIVNVLSENERRGVSQKMSKNK